MQSGLNLDNPVNNDGIEAMQIGTEEELVLFCMELLENMSNITAALKMISERTCRFYDLDDMVCVEHGSASNRILYQWSGEERTGFAHRMQGHEVYEWSHLRHLTDPSGCIVCRSKQIPQADMDEVQSALLVLSTSVRGYSGSIVFADRHRDRDWGQTRNTLVRIANQIFYKLRMMKKEAESRHTLDLRLNFDRLTGLPVYDHFISSAKEYMLHYGSTQLCCIYTDFTNFQYYNEVYGFEMGDKILKRFADALTMKYGSCGLFARLGSDHFAGLVRGMTKEDLQEDYRCFTAEFAAECNKEFPLTNLVLASGIYEVPETELNVGVMMDNANEARKKCKEQQVETMVKVYTDELRQEIENAREVNSNILKAIQNKEFHAYLQPKVNVKSGKIVGAEALVRWIRPNGSMVMPDEFIHIAEKNGYITKIDFVVLDQVIAYLKEAVENGEEVVPVSVNFSRRNNEFEGFVPSILRRLEANHIPGHLLEAEVTESMYMADLSVVEDNMNRLRSQGIEVAVDDFGSGYSALNLLSKISADTIKLDKLFLSSAAMDERGLTVIQHLTKMLKCLGFTVLAEGVETEEQMDWMRKTDCDVIQGYYYAKPMSIPDFRKFLAEFNFSATDDKREMA